MAKKNLYNVYWEHIQKFKKSSFNAKIEDYLTKAHKSIETSFYFLNRYKKDLTKLYFGKVVKEIFKSLSRFTSR